MLPKIGAALVQFIPPIASSGKRSQVNGNKQNKDKKEFQKFVPQPEQKQSSKDDRSPDHPPDQPLLVEEVPPKNQFTQKEKIPPGTLALKNRQHSSEGGGVAHAFITLLSLFQKRRSALSKWFGLRSYQVAAKEQKHAIKARKGAVVDDKAA